jgi:preprotein translocase subunit SecE
LAEQPDQEPARLGATRYVHAAFFGAGMLTAYLSGKLLTVFWNALAEWSVATRAVPQLLAYAEGERESLAMLVGVVIGVLAVIQTYRREGIRRWADEVAEELSRVTWPNKEMVTNGTIVVLIAGAIATVYIALLDRFWGFLTTLVYGA